MTFNNEQGNVGCILKKKILMRYLLAGTVEQPASYRAILVGCLFLLAHVTNVSARISEHCSN